MCLLQAKQMKIMSLCNYIQIATFIPYFVEMNYYMIYVLFLFIILSDPVPYH